MEKVALYTQQTYVGVGLGLVGIGIDLTGILGGRMARLTIKVLL